MVAIRNFQSQSLSIWLLGSCCVWAYTVAPNRRIMNFIGGMAIWTVTALQYLLSEFNKATCQNILAGLANLFCRCPDQQQYRIVGFRQFCIRAAAPDDINLRGKFVDDG